MWQRNLWIAERACKICDQRGCLAAGDFHIEGFRRLAEKKARDHAGFSFVFKARRQAHSRTM
jgi:hypothetical protein